MILSNGFFALLDHENRIIFRTENVRDPVELETIVSAAEQHKAIDRRWLVKLKTFVPWDYDVACRALSAETSPKKPSRSSGRFYGIGSVILLGVLVVSFLLASRLSEALGDAEMSRREAVEARDAAQAANRTEDALSREHEP